MAISHNHWAHDQLAGLLRGLLYKSLAAKGLYLHMRP